EGRPLYGEMRFLSLLGDTLPKDYTTITVGGRPMFVIGRPDRLYAEIRKKVGFTKVLDYLPFEP
ncbi:MAG: hydrolase, partial [Termitinemataceae bacterium]